MPNNIDYLRNIHLFVDLSTEQLEQVANLVIERKYQRGRIIFMENEPGEAVYLLKKGRVKVFKQDEDGREHILHYINPGEVFGEVVLFDGGDYPACTEVVEDSEIGFIRNKDMDELVIKNPSIALALLKYMSRRLRFAQHQIMELALKDTTRRLASVLLQLAHEHGTHEDKGIRISLNLTNQELASMIGTSRETANRILSEFRRGKAVLIEKQDIIVLTDKLKTWL